jgi:hypothetical protein
MRGLRLIHLPRLGRRRPPENHGVFPTSPGHPSFSAECPVKFKVRIEGIEASWELTSEVREKLRSDGRRVAA